MKYILGSLVTLAFLLQILPVVLSVPSGQLETLYEAFESPDSNNVRRWQIECLRTTAVGDSTFVGILQQINNGLNEVTVAKSTLPENIFLLNISSVKPGIPYKGATGLFIAFQVDRNQAIVGSKALLAGADNKSVHFVSVIDSIDKNLNLGFVEAEMIGDTIVISEKSSELTSTDITGDIWSVYYKYLRGRLVFLEDSLYDPTAEQYKFAFAALDSGNIKAAVNHFEQIEYPDRIVGRMTQIAAQILQVTYIVTQQLTLKLKYTEAANAIDDFLYYGGVDPLVDTYSHGYQVTPFTGYNTSNLEKPSLDKDTLIAQFVFFATCCLKAGKPENAIKLSQYITGILPDKPEGYHLLSEGYTLLKDSTNAALTYKKYDSLMSVHPVEKDH
jgi:hypothetical protein